MAQRTPAGLTMEVSCVSIDKILRKTKTTYEAHLKVLDELTQVLVSENHEKANRTWLGHDWDGLQPPNEPFNFCDYTEIPDMAVNHLVGGDRDKVIAQELQNIYNRLQRIKIATDQIREEHENKKAQHLRDNLYTADEKFFPIKSSFFFIQEEYLSKVIKEVGDTLKGLSKNVLPILEIEPHDISNPDVRDWVVIREYLKLLHYITKACIKLKERCSN